MYMGRPSLICRECEPWPVRIPRLDVGDTVGLMQIVGCQSWEKSWRFRRQRQGTWIGHLGCSSKSLAESKTIRSYKDRVLIRYTSAANLIQY